MLWHWLIIQENPVKNNKSGVKMVNERKADLAKFLVKLLYNPKVVFENENIQGSDLDEPMVIICNHSRKTHKYRLAEADGPMIRYAFDNKNVCSLVAKDIYEKPIMNSMMRNLDCITVDRFSATTGWVRDCIAEMKKGKSVIIFPEGTTLKTREIDEFKSGFLLLAKAANVKVLPVAIKRNYSLIKKRTMIKVGVPYRLSSNKLIKSERQKEIKRFRDIVVNLYCDITGNNFEEATREHTLQYKTLTK